MSAVTTLILSIILLNPVRLYFQPDSPVLVNINTQALTKLTHASPQAPLKLLLLDSQGHLYGKADLKPDTAQVDLARMFGKKPGHRFHLWDGRTYFIQLEVAGQSIGTPLVVVPLKQPGHAKGGPDALRVYPEMLVDMTTSLGPIGIRLDPQAAPHNTLVFSELVNGGFYTNVLLHRVVPGFVIQGGDPTGLGTGGPGFFTDLEVSDKPHQRGTVSMARQGNSVNTAGSQFFICLSREACAPLDGKYTAFGDVVWGMDTVARISALPLAEDGSGRPLDPPVIRQTVLIPAPPRPVESPPPDTLRPPETSSPAAPATAEPSKSTTHTQ